jgi:hypothetical protein
MLSITSSAGLKDAILLLEAEQTEKKQILQDHLRTTFDSLKPINLIKSALKDISESPYLIDNIVGTAIGVATGYISRKVVVGGSGNPLRKLIGSVIQFGVTNVVAQHPDGIKSVIHFIYNHFLRKKEDKSVNP